MKLFGTDGIRDLAGAGKLAPERVMRIGRALGTLLKTERHLFETPLPDWLPHPDGPPAEVDRVLIAGDTRVSGYLIGAALVTGLLASGRDVTLLGVLPTPALAYLTAYWHAALGVMISASHNPAVDNGLKIFSPQGLKISPAAEQRIEAVVAEQAFSAHATGTDVGIVRENSKGKMTYAGALFRYFRNRVKLEGMKIALDCAHGAAAVTALMVLRELGARVITMGITPDGTNINGACGALYPEAVAELVLSEKADLGISLDGDADRVVLVDEQGQSLDGDQIMALLAPTMQRRDALRNNTVVATVMSNLGLELFLQKHGITLIRTAVGDRQVMDAMLQGGYHLGGEQSGHIIVLGTGFVSGDGLASALQVLEILSSGDTPLSELSRTFTSVPQVLRNVKVKTKPPLEEVCEPLLGQLRQRLGKEGRIVLRYSGTEAVARVMVEGLDQELVESVVQQLAHTIEEKIGENSAN